MKLNNQNVNRDPLYTWEEMSTVLKALSESEKENKELKAQLTHRRECNEP